MPFSTTDGISIGGRRGTKLPVAKGQPCLQTVGAAAKVAARCSNALAGTGFIYLTHDRTVASGMTSHSGTEISRRNEYGTP